MQLISTPVLSVIELRQLSPVADDIYFLQGYYDNYPGVGGGFLVLPMIHHYPMTA